MSLKSIIQFLIILLIISIIGGVYFKYFETNKNVIEEINTLETNNLNQIKEMEKKISDLQLKNKELSDKIADSQNKREETTEKNNNEIDKTKVEDEVETNLNQEVKTETKEINNNKKDEKKNKSLIEKKKIINLVKNVEYTSVDQKGNRFDLLAKSGKSSIDNKDVLELENVKGKIKSDNRDTIYIVSDYAKYNLSNLNSKFYKNVIINYQNKKITCSNFDINMEKNIAIAYNDVVITDPKSIMKAGIVEFDLKTKDININPEKTSTEVEVIVN